MSNIVIVGSGPAGVSAALYAVRAGVDTTVLTKGPGALDRAEKIENYYGLAQPVSGAELERRSIENAKRLGVRFVTAEAVGLTYTDKLTVGNHRKRLPGGRGDPGHRGASRVVPRIPGLAGLEGHGVSWCAVCDAIFLPRQRCGRAGQRCLCPARGAGPAAGGEKRQPADQRHAADRRIPAGGDRIPAEGGGCSGRTGGHRGAAVRRAGGCPVRCVRGAGRGGQHCPGPQDRGRRGGQPHRGG